MIPSFDPASFARDLEDATQRDTLAPPFEASAYARIVDGPVPLGSPAVPRAMATTAAPPRSRPSDVLSPSGAEELGREMYRRYLASDYPAALSLAERVLQAMPDDPFATVVVERSRERVGSVRLGTLRPSSVVRLREDELVRNGGLLDPTSSFLLGHVDGISDAATVAALTGLPGSEALDRLHALVDLGILEVIRS